MRKEHQVWYRRRRLTRWSWLKRFRGEEGATIVEMAIACSILFSMIFGVVQLSMVLYCYTFVAEAAREASRYAATLGQNSCLSASVTPYPNCNLGPTAVGSSQTSYTTSPLQTYVRGLGLPFASTMTVSATWWSPTGATPQQWTDSCTTQMDTGTGPLGNSATQCNYPGHAVKVTVSHDFPIAIPFVNVNTMTIQSTSMMVINE